MDSCRIRKAVQSELAASSVRCFVEGLHGSNWWVI